METWGIVSCFHNHLMNNILLQRSKTCWSASHDHLRWNISYCNNQNMLVCTTWSSKLKYWSSCLAVPQYNKIAVQTGYEGVAVPLGLVHASRAKPTHYTAWLKSLPSSPWPLKDTYHSHLGWAGVLGGILMVPHHYMPDSSPRPLQDLPFRVGGVGRGIPVGASSLHARFFPMTFERYISLPFQVGGVGGVYWCFLIMTCKILSHDLCKNYHLGRVQGWGVSCWFLIITCQILPNDLWKIAYDTYRNRLGCGGVAGSILTVPHHNMMKMTMMMTMMMMMMMMMMVVVVVGVASVSPRPQGVVALAVRVSYHVPTVMMMMIIIIMMTIFFLCLFFWEWWWWWWCCLLLMMIIASPGNRWRGTVNLLPDLFGMMIAHDRMHLTVIPNE